MNGAVADCGSPKGGMVPSSPEDVHLRRRMAAVLARIDQFRYATNVLFLQTIF
jgi:hypothetical protein